MKHHKSVFTILDILSDLMRGGRHSRTTLARQGLSYPTADRWLRELERRVPGVIIKRTSGTTWYEFKTNHHEAAKLRKRVRDLEKALQPFADWDTDEASKYYGLDTAIVEARYQLEEYKDD